MSCKGCFFALGVLLASSCISLQDQCGNQSDSSVSVISRRRSIVKKLFQNYDGTLPPNFDSHKSVFSTVQVYVLSIDSISETNMDFALGLFIRQTWNDTRLAHNHHGNVKVLELDTRMMNQVWVPDLYIPSEKKAAVHTVTVPNKLMHIHPSGRVQYSQRVSATLKCNFDLRKYPMDSQSCKVEMESYGYTTDTLQFRWHNVPVEVKKGLKIPQFELGHILSEQCDKRYNDASYTCVKFEFEFHRSMGYYLTQVYLPSVLIVMLSWVSFWLDIQAVPARISLGLLTVLSMTTQSSGVRASLPKVSYVKAIDVWMAMCLVFVFLALIQFAYVNVLARVHDRRKKVVSADLSSVAVGSPSPQSEDDEENEAEKPKKWPGLLRRPSTITRLYSKDREKARNIDRISRVFFPLAFIVFNVIYWSVYTLWLPYRGAH